MFERLLTQLRRQFSMHPLDRQLFPALKEEVLFRLYRPDDRAACMELYRRLEPNRFPTNGIALFEKYLNEESKTFIIAELHGKVVGCGGISLAGPQVAILCFGFVAPELQGKRIGATLTLLRLAQLPSSAKGYYVFIFSVEKSMPIYKRFGFVEAGHWKTEIEPDVLLPVGMLGVPDFVLNRVKRVLQKRGIKVVEPITVSCSKDIVCRVEPDSSGLLQFKWKKKIDPKNGAK